MDSTTEKQHEDEFYFEDDDDFNEYPGCSVTLPPVPDPISLLNPDRLAVRYGGEWPRYDSFRVNSQPGEYRPAVAFINNVRVPINKRTDLYDYVNSLSDLPKQRTSPLDFRSPSCPYCTSVIGYHQVVNGISGWDDEEHVIDEMDESADVKAMEFCHNCRYWRWHDVRVRTSFGSVEHSYTGFLSKIREFDAQLPEGFTQELAQWIRRDQKRWHVVASTRLEKLVADIMKSVYQHAQVLHVGRPDDDGVDVVLIETDGSKWLIQVKGRESSRAAEPVDTVRSLLGTMFLQGASCGMVVSTADHFTYRAYEAANRAHEKGAIVRLLNREMLNRLLDAVLPDQPWTEFLAKEYPQLLHEFQAALGRTA